jgi:REP element-mobilizing transposase RayT
MSTYTQILYHLVFSTKDRQPVLSDSRREFLSGLTLPGVAALTDK